MNEGEHEEALGLATRGLEFEPELVALLNMQACALAGLDRKPDAEASLRRSLTAEPAKSETLALLARLRADQNLRDEAAHLYRLALRISPGDE